MHQRSQALFPARESAANFSLVLAVGQTNSPSVSDVVRIDRDMILEKQIP